MSSRLIIDGNAVYEIDEDCLKNGEVRPARRTREYPDLKKQENRKDAGKGK